MRSCVPFISVQAIERVGDWYGRLSDDVLISGRRPRHAARREGDDVLVGGRGADVLLGGPASDIVIQDQATELDRSG